MGWYVYPLKEIKAQIDIDFLINNQTSVKFYCSVIVFEARIDFKLGQYVYHQRELKAQITSNSYSSTIEIKPWNSSSVNRNDFLHESSPVCLLYNESRSENSFLLEIKNDHRINFINRLSETMIINHKFRARINFKPWGYNYHPLKLKAQILSNSLIINHKIKEGQTHPSLQGALRRKAPQFTS